MYISEINLIKCNLIKFKFQQNYKILKTNLHIIAKGFFFS